MEHKVVFEIHGHHATMYTASYSAAYAVALVAVRGGASKVWINDRLITDA